MKDDLGRLTSEDILRFEKAVSEGKALAVRQEEIAKKVLKLEKDIGKVRIASLDQYFDAYSKGLDEVLTRKTSQLNDAFLIFDNKIDEAIKRAETKARSFSEELKEIVDENSQTDAKPNKTSKTKQKDRQANAADEYSSDLSTEIRTAQKAESKKASKRKANTKTSNKARTTDKFEESQQQYTEIDSQNNSDSNIKSLTKLSNRKGSNAKTANSLASKPTSRRLAIESEASKESYINNTDAYVQSFVDNSQQNDTSSTQLKTQNDSNNGGNGGSGDNDGVSGGGGNINPIVVNDESPISDEQYKALNEGNRLSEGIAQKFDLFIQTYESKSEQMQAIVKNKKDAISTIDVVKELRQAKRDEQKKEYEGKEDNLLEILNNLNVARLQENKDTEANVKDLQIDQKIDYAKSQLKTQETINEVKAKRLFEEDPNTHAIEAKKAEELELQKSIAELEERRVKDIAKQEREFKKKNNREASAEERADMVKKANEKYKLDQKNLDALTKKRQEAEKRQAKVAEAREHLEERNALRSEVSTLRSAETFEERKQALYNLTHDDDGNADIGKAMSAAILAVSDVVKQLETKMDDIASNKSAVDTRLQGSSMKTRSGSYWDQIYRDMTSVGAVNPYFKQTDFANNIKSLVDAGIAFDLEQRAFLMTIKDKIATTFDVSNSTLLKIIRIQQADSTAGRLGMEAALNSFLNEMYENTEYLKTIATSVRDSLYEMESLMDAAAATEVEYEVQKWLGSLYSVGMSDSAVNSISTALGQIAAGQIEGLTNGGAANLLIMAANDAGIPIADVLSKGLNADETNELLKASVNYLAELAESSKDSRVVQQQLANVFGVKASDLKAATNLVSKDSIESISGVSMTYDNMLAKLIEMADTMGDRTSIAEMLTNIWDNGQYTLAGSIASSPAMYGLFKMANLLDKAVGGIDLPFVNVMGFGVDLNTTVSDLMRVASLSGGILSSIGSIASGLSNSFSGMSMLEELGIKSESGITVTPRGSVESNYSGGGKKSTSESGYAGYTGNASGSDIKDSTLQEAEDSKKQQMIEAKEEEEANQVTVLNDTVIKIYELLDDVVSGKQSLKVKVEEYGLTRSGGSLGLNNSSLFGNDNSSSNVNTSGSGSVSNNTGSGAGGGTSGGSVSTSFNSNGISFGTWNM